MHFHQFPSVSTNFRCWWTLRRRRASISIVKHSLIGHGAIAPSIHSLNSYGTIAPNRIWLPNTHWMARAPLQSQKKPWVWPHSMTELQRIVRVGQHLQTNNNPMYVSEIVTGCIWIRRVLDWSKKWRTAIATTTARINMFWIWAKSVSTNFRCWWTLRRRRASISIVKHSLIGHGAIAPSIHSLNSYGTIAPNRIWLPNTHWMARAPLQSQKKPWVWPHSMTELQRIVRVGQHLQTNNNPMYVSEIVTGCIWIRRVLDWSKKWRTAIATTTARINMFWIWAKGKWLDMQSSACLGLVW